jgi:acylpyruvate hydrolase
MKIICIGRNYADHAKELNNDLPNEPVFFIKPDTCSSRNGQAFYLPDFSNEIHHEVELVIKICRVGKNIERRFAHKYYQELGIGIDFTARDIQEEQKKKGLPWEKAKAFDGSAPIGNFIPKSALENLNNVNFKLIINNKLAQQGNSNQMIFDFDAIIEYVSKFITLKIGDLIYTGTPAGVGKINIGDQLECFIEDQKLLHFKIK